MPVIVTRKEEVEDIKDGENSRSYLAQIPCIRYPINLKKKSVLMLLDLDSKINAIYLAFAKELGLLIRLTNVGA